MLRLRRTIVFLAIALPLWLVAWNFFEGLIYGTDTYKSVVTQLKNDPVYVGLLEKYGLTAFSAGPSALVSFDGTEGHYTFAVEGAEKSVQEIIEESGFDPLDLLSMSREDFRDLAKPPSENITFRVDWRELEPGVVQIERISLSTQTVYESATPNAG